MHEKAERVLLRHAQQKLDTGHEQMPVTDLWLSGFIILPRKTDTLIPHGIKFLTYTCNLLTSKAQVIGDGAQKIHTQVPQVS